MLHTIKSQLVELVVQGLPNPGQQATRFYFQDQPFLRQKSLVSLETFFREDSSAGMTSITGNALVTSAIGTNAYLTLYGNDPETPPGNAPTNGGVVAQGEWLQYIPLVKLHRVNNQASPFVFEKETYIPRIIVWEKSYITVPSAPANTVNFSFLLDVGYMGFDSSVS
jgi:hypothetical protein